MGFKIYILIFYFCCTLKISSEFNVDVSHPIIISNTADGPASYFGASVQIFKKNDDLSWVIIGAPRANSTYPNHRNITEPGVVWRCSLGKSSDYCEVVMMDPTNFQDVPERAVRDKKDGGWLGATLSSDKSDRFVTCASRWANQRFAYDPNYPKSNEFFLHGICYWRPKQDLLEDTMQDLPPNYRLLPLSHVDDLPNQGDIMWTFGQSGFAQHVTSENKLILGAPGISLWRGSVILYSDADQGVRLQRNGQPEAFPNTFANNITVRSDLGNTVGEYDYFGYAVNSGNFFTPKSNEKVQYVGGAPRAALLSGQVVIFNFPKTKEEPLEKLQVINGTQIGSYFGSVLCVIDINRDGFDDLIIGAPHFSSTKASILPIKFESLKVEKTDEGDEGAAFVFISTGESLIQQSILQGDNKPESQFGTAISTVGDLNQDGFYDLVISAPYSKQGQGSIYIYHGTAKGVQSKYSQVVHASEISSSLRGFGYSLSSGVDFDNNGYNDLAIGSIYSAEIVILRTRPAVVLTGSLKSSVARLPLNATEFKISSCVSFSGYKLPAQLTVGVKVFMDVDSASSPRVLIKQFKTDTPAREVTYKQEASKEKEICTELIGEVVRSLQSEHPIKMRQEAFLMESTTVGTRKKRSDQTTMFTIKRAASGSISTEQSGKKIKDFCSTCPLTSQAQQNTSIVTLPMEIKCGEDDKCVADLRIEARFLEIDSGANFTIGSSQTVTLVVTVNNYQETAIGPEVTISFSRRSLKSVPKTCKHIQMELSSSYKCSLGRFLEQDGSASVSMEFDMSDLVAGRQMLENEYIFHVEATTASELLQPAALDLVLPIVASADSHLYASRKVMKFNEKTLQPYQISSHIYEVRLKGPSTVSSLRLSFQVPVNLTRTQDSKEVVQVLNAKAEIDGVDVHCQATNGKFYQKLSESSGSEKPLPSEFQPDPKLDVVFVGESKARDIRRKRDTLHVAPRIIRKKQMTIERTTYFECTSRFVDCMEIVCMFPEFRPSSRGSVTISLRVSSDTVRKMFEEERTDVFVVASQGEVTIPNASEDIQMYNELPDTDESSTTIILETPKKVSKWIIVGSIVMGVLLLFLIFLCCYALGCLTRNKRQVETPEEEDEVDAMVVTENHVEDFEESDDDVPQHIPEKPGLVDALEPITEEHEEHSS